MPHNETQDATSVTATGRPPFMEGGIATKQQQIITPPPQKTLLLRVISKIPGIAHPGQIDASEQIEENGQEVALPLEESNKTVMAPAQEAPILLDKVEEGVLEGTHTKPVLVKPFFGLSQLVKRVFERPSGKMLRRNQDMVWEEPEAASAGDIWSEDLDKLEAAAAAWAEHVALTESESLSRTKDRDVCSGESQSQLIHMMQQPREKRPLQGPTGIAKKRRQILQCPFRHTASDSTKKEGITDSSSLAVNDKTYIPHILPKVWLVCPF